MAQQVHVLIVDEDDGERAWTADVLREAGYRVSAVGSGEEALEQMAHAPFRLVVSDLRLGGDHGGLRLLREVRQRSPGMGFVVLTSYASLESAMRAINEGVDAYLLKPIEAAGLRLGLERALTKRWRQGRVEPETEELHHGPLSLSRAAEWVTIDGEPVDLTPSEFALLRYLMENPGRVASPGELVEAMWGHTETDKGRARRIVKWHIHHLRRKLEPDPARPRLIINVHGVGYSFAAGDRTDAEQPN